MSEQPNEPLRIVIGAETFFPDVNGAATFARQLARGMSSLGHAVHVVAPSPDTHPRVEGLDNFAVHYVRSVRVPFHASMHFKLPWQDPAAMRRIVSELAPDVVHLQSALFIGPPLAAAARSAGVPVIGTNHVVPENLMDYRPAPKPAKDAFAKAVWLRLLRVYDQCDAVTAPTERAVELLTASGLKHEAYPISCGIDLTGPLRDAATPRPERDVPTVLFIGRLDPEKHVCDLVEAIARMPRDVPLRAKIIGIGNERANLERLAVRCGVADRVEFLGFVSDEDLRGAYRDADFFCMPSIAELQSLVTLEAVASKLPVIACNELALPHLVHDGVNGFLVERSDVDGYARRLTELARDRELRLRMGEAGVAIARQHDQATTLRLFELIYRYVIARRRAGGGMAGLEPGVFERLAAAAGAGPEVGDA